MSRQNKKKRNKKKRRKKNPSRSSTRRNVIDWCLNNSVRSDDYFSSCARFLMSVEAYPTALMSERQFEWYAQILAAYRQAQKEQQLELAID